MKAKSKLEEYFKNYMKEKGETVKHDNFSTYVDREFDSEKAMSDALERSYASSRENNAENLYSAGLSRSGYADYLREKKLSAYEKEKKALSAERDREVHSYAKNYQSYLDGIIQKNEGLKRTVTNELISKQIVPTLDAVKYAIERGLSAKDAESVAHLSYSTLKTKLRGEIIQLAVSYEIDAVTAENMALAYGLKKDDARDIYIKVLNLTSRTPASDSRFDEYEKESDKNSNTDIFKERNLK